MPRGPLHKCFRCKSGEKPLRAKTFYAVGHHETYYTCYACYLATARMAERKMGRKLPKTVNGPWEDLPPVPFTGADAELDARLAADGE